MKKILIGLSLIASTILFSADNSYNTQFLDTAVQDAYHIHNTFKDKLDMLLNSNQELQKYTSQVDDLEEKISNYLQTQAKQFSSKEDAQKALDDLEKLSTQITVLAKTTAYLASHHADSTNESYNNTIQTTSKTILRLSDDIGTMADRIGNMADKIGVMADRIIKTQEIQSKNYNATLQLTKYTVDTSSHQADSNKNFSTPHNMNAMSQNSNMQQNIIPMH